MPVALLVATVAVWACAPMQGDVKAHVPHWRLLDLALQKKMKLPQAMRLTQVETIPSPQMPRLPATRNDESPQAESMTLP